METISKKLINLSSWIEKYIIIAMINSQCFRTKKSVPEFPQLKLFMSNHQKYYFEYWQCFEHEICWTWGYANTWWTCFMPTTNLFKLLWIYIAIIKTMMSMSIYKSDYRIVDLYNICWLSWFRGKAVDCCTMGLGFVPGLCLCPDERLSQRWHKTTFF
jgi:hypothetical protein